MGKGVRALAGDLGAGAGQDDAGLCVHIRLGDFCAHVAGLSTNLASQGKRGVSPSIRVCSQSSTGTAAPALKVQGTGGRGSSSVVSEAMVIISNEKSTDKCQK